MSKVNICGSIIVCNFQANIVGSIIWPSISNDLAKGIIEITIFIQVPTVIDNILARII